MRKYLLDTTPLSAFLQGHRRAVTLIGPWIASQEVTTSILCYGEVYEYIKSFPNFTMMHIQLRQLLFTGAVPTLTLTPGIVERYADIRRALRPTNSQIGDVDTLIGATSLEYNLAVVTASMKHLSQIPGLIAIPY